MSDDYYRGEDVLQKTVNAFISDEDVFVAFSFDEDQLLRYGAVGWGRAVYLERENTDTTLFDVYRFTYPSSREESIGGQLSSLYDHFSVGEEEDEDELQCLHMQKRYEVQLPQPGDYDPDDDMFSHIVANMLFSSQYGFLHVLGGDRYTFPLSDDADAPDTLMDLDL